MDRVKQRLLVGAIALTLGLALPGPGAAASGGETASAGGRRVYIVQFEEPALASYRGPATLDKSAPRLSATSPAATGARKLDVGSAASRAYLDFLRDRRTARLADARQRLGRELRPRYVYDVVLNGVAVELDADEVQSLATLPGVKRVEPEWVDRVHTDAGPRWIEADQVWNDAGLPVSARRGEGVVVGVVDTGIHSAHPSFAAVSPGDGYVHSNPRGQVLGLCAGGQAACNNKLIGIYNFTDEGIDGSDVNGHGSHVASTAVGNPTSTNISGVTRTLSGVAPRANLISYKACIDDGGSGTCSGSDLLAALQQTLVDQVDVVNYSIGGTASDPWTRSDSVAMRDLRNASVVVAVSAGNDGPIAGSVTGPGNAPWVLTAAAATHTRLQGNRLFLSGGDTSPPNGGVLTGASAAGASASFPLVHAEPRLCAEGADVALGGANFPSAWTSSTWSGRMVLCDRGIYARVDKSRNVGNAGGGAMVLLNQPTEGASVVADAHSVPSTHLAYAEAQALLQWLASGSGHTGRLDASTVRDNPGSADILADFSGRGPASAGSLIVSSALKPNVAAPGVNILAADNEGSGFVYMSGTSMAAPHVAGAAALLRAAHPSWGANEIITALSTTARDSVRLPDGITPATPFDQGSGTIDVGKAVRAALSFNATIEEFIAASPSSGGVVRNLNLPALVHEDCAESCSLSRRVTDLAGGSSWQVQAQGLPAGMTVTATPASFTLAAGETRTITFRFDIDAPALAGDWRYGKVVLTAADGSGRPAQTLPVAVYVDPGVAPPAQDLDVASDRGHFELSVPGLVAMPDARFAGTPLVAPEVRVETIAQDATSDDPYDNLDSGVSWVGFELPAPPDEQPREYRVIATAESSTAPDVDLFVGTGDAPAGFAQVCSSTSPTAEERCEFTVTHPGGDSPMPYWALLQNWCQPGQCSGTHAVRLEAAAVPQVAENETLVVTGPGHVASGESFPLRVTWDDPGFLPDEVRLGYALLSAQPGVVTAAVPLRLHRTGTDRAAYALQDGVAHNLRLAPSEAHEGLYFEVPPQASQVKFAVSGSGAVDLYALRADTASSPTIAPATGWASSPYKLTGTGGVKTLVLDDAKLGTGRWHLVPHNTGGTPVQVSVTAQVTGVSTPPTLRSGHYFNPERSGHGAFLDFAGPAGAPDQWIMVWYTYREDGTPTWYYAQGPVPGSAGIWRAELFHVTWNGGATSATDVGDIVITASAADRLTFSYNLHGESGSEAMARLGGGGCPLYAGQPLDASGHFYAPSLSGFGYSAQFEPATQVMAAYLYDDRGDPRWLIGQKDYATPAQNDTIELQQLAGFCPLCTYAPPTSSVVGTATRVLGANFDGATGIDRIGVDTSFVAPLSGAWAQDRTTEPLSQRKSCR